MNCPQCDIEMELVDTQTWGKSTWNDYACPFCDYYYSDEPDWDSMPGGHDDY